MEEESCPCGAKYFARFNCIRCGRWLSPKRISELEAECARLTERCTKLQAKAWGMAAELRRLAKELEESE